MVNLEPVEAARILCAAVTGGAGCEVRHCWSTVGFGPRRPEELYLRTGRGRSNEGAGLGVCVADNVLGANIIDGTVAGHAPADTLGLGILVDVRVGSVASITVE